MYLRRNSCHCATARVTLPSVTRTEVKFWASSARKIRSTSYHNAHDAQPSSRTVRKLSSRKCALAGIADASGSGSEALPAQSYANLQWRPVLAKPELLVCCGPGNGVAQTGHFHKHVCATLQGPFRGLPRPSEASLMGFRGLPRPCEASTKSQNPFSLQDYEASGLELI